MPDLLSILQSRDLVHDATPGLAERLAEEPVTAYVGFDPTAHSLHVGNLIPVMALCWLQRLGGLPIVVVGGGTGLVGDPSGKRGERPMLSVEAIDANAAAIRKQLNRFLAFEGPAAARMLDNAAWLRPLLLMEFLRDTGKHFTVNYMLQKESVMARMESGISFTEFAYMLVQAYDFHHLFTTEGCELQMGGSDQWGNILAGTDLIRRLRGARAHGLVFPLVTSSSGVKFGKTEAGAVWLDAKMTSPYRFYQFWLNTDDRDAVTYLKFFTWLSQEEIEALELCVKTEPEKREAQRRLAREVTAMLHGETELEKAVRASEVLFGKEISGMSVDEIIDIFADVPSTELDRSKVESDGFTLSDALVLSGLAPSKGEAKRLVQGGGVAVNNVRADDPRKSISVSDLIDGQVLVLRKGAKHYHLIKIVR